MDKEHAHNIALMRYSVIAPLVSGLSDGFPSKEDFFRDASTKDVEAPDGTRRRFAPSTIKRWHRLYNKGGFDALIPSGRSDSGKPRRLDGDVQEQIRYLKENYPHMSAAAVCRQLCDNGSLRPGSLSQSTVRRYLNVLDAETGAATPGRDMRRYERPHINEVWCGDISTGLYLKVDDGKKHKAYIIALIDDASRFIVGAGAFFNDNLST